MYGAMILNTSCIPVFGCQHASARRPPGFVTRASSREELELLGDNMPFGTIGKGEFGTYFIGYACSPERIERMLANMFVGLPPGNYDRILDFSRAVTGSLFFVPTSDFLDDLPPAPAG